jgi:hypothetical protein
MRINLYGEELTKEVVTVRKTVNDEEFGERTFIGLRIFLKSPSDLHHSKEDDDRSAVTIWIKQGDHTQEEMLEEIVFNLLAEWQEF